jgi:hypothetical protein
MYEECCLVHCYYTEASQEVRELMWKYIIAGNGWISAHPFGMFMYIQRDLASPLLLLDPDIVRKPEMDYLL